VVVADTVEETSEIVTVLLVWTAEDEELLPVGLGHSVTFLAP
jgi:hypothetical protein